MSIVIDENLGLFTLHTHSSTYQIKVGPYGFVLHTYYGPRIDGEDLSYLLPRRSMSFSANPADTGSDRSFSMDSQPQEYATYGATDYRESALQVTGPDGAAYADLRYDGFECCAGKYGLEGLPALYGEGFDTLKLYLIDAHTGLRVTLLYGVLEQEDVITRAALIENRSTAPLSLDRALSLCLDFPTSDYDLYTFHGRHCRERIPQRTPLPHGKLRVDSLRGASSHQYNPFIILCDRGASEDAGCCYGASLVYSGSFLAQAEVDQAGATRLVMGIHPDTFRWSLAPGDVFTVPEVCLTFSGEGLTGLSHRLHRAFRDHLCRGKFRTARRPVLINSWEAVYFDFDSDKLVEIARSAVPLGVELLVMDDGWFGKRDDDNSGLGDWVVNEKKLKGSLAELARRVNECGLGLGIWIEPEMVSEDSDLYRAHPDWCLHIPGRAGSRSRNQLVLDMGRSDVQDYLLASISDVLRSANIAYVKWDMNRHLTEVGSAVLPAGRQGEAGHRHILGVYRLMDRLTAAFPDILFEGCSGGGGRFDAGMLYYTPQIWCSDDTDAAERLIIQYGTSFGYPISTVGSHVSVCPNHQTGRTTPLHTRGVVAMAGTFGYELDISRMSEEEKQEVSAQVALYKRNYTLINQGDYYRLSDVMAQSDYAAWLFVSPAQDRALFNFVQRYAQAASPGFRIRLKGLKPQARYRIGDTGLTLSGAALMGAGLYLPPMDGDYRAVQWEIEEI